MDIWWWESGRYEGTVLGRNSKSFLSPKKYSHCVCCCSCWSQAKQPTDVAGYTFSCFVGYWLHHLIKAATKWSLCYAFSQPREYWPPLLFFSPPCFWVWKVHYLQLLQNQSGLVKISDGIYSIINVLPHQYSHTWKAWGVLFWTIFLHHGEYLKKNQFHRAILSIYILRSTSPTATELIFHKADIIAEKTNIIDKEKNLSIKKKISVYWNLEGKLYTSSWFLSIWFSSIFLASVIFHFLCKGFCLFIFVKKIVMLLKVH